MTYEHDVTREGIRRFITLFKLQQQEFIRARLFHIVSEGSMAFGAGSLRDFSCGKLRGHPAMYF